MQCNRHLQNASLQARDIQLKDEKSRDTETCNGVSKAR